MRASSGFVRLFIRGLAWDASESGQSFADALKTAARAQLTNSAKGKVLVGTSSGGTSVTYTLPPLGGLSAEDVAEVCSKLLDHCDTLVAADADITDAQLKTALLALFPKITTCRPDFYGANLR